MVLCLSAGYAHASLYSCTVLIQTHEGGGDLCSNAGFSRNLHGQCSVAGISSISLVHQHWRASGLYSSTGLSVRASGLYSVRCLCGNARLSERLSCMYSEARLL